jgi:hypothetical protein
MHAGKAEYVCLCLCDCSVVTLVLAVLREAMFNSSSLKKGDSMFICMHLKTVTGPKTMRWIEGNPVNLPLSSTFNRMVLNQSTQIGVTFTGSRVNYDSSRLTS